MHWHYVCLVSHTSCTKKVEIIGIGFRVWWYNIKPLLTPVTKRHVGSLLLMQPLHGHCSFGCALCFYWWGLYPPRGEWLILSIPSVNISDRVNDRRWKQLPVSLLVANRLLPSCGVLLSPSLLLASGDAADHHIMPETCNDNSSCHRLRLSNRKWLTVEGWQCCKMLAATWSSCDNCQWLH